MFHRTIASAALVALIAGPVSGQDPAPPAASPDEHLTALGDALKDVNANEPDQKEAAVNQVVASIDQLSANYKSYPEAEQKKVAEGITKIFGVRLKEGPEDSVGARVYYAAAAALSEMGELGEVGLKKALKTKHLEKLVEVQTTLIESLGKHRNPKNVSMLVDLLVNDDPKIVVAAVNALSEYREADGKVRKQIAEELVKQYATTYNADLRAKGNDTTARDRLLAIEVPMNQALAMITLQNLQSAPEWEKWYNDNRNRKW